MPRITYISHDGRTTTLDLADGTSVMMGAVHGNVKGIEGECGGCLTCATCHVYVDAAWVGRLAAPDADELAMLEMTVAERRDNSRLSCQIIARPELDGLVVRLPDRQI